MNIADDVIEKRTQPDPTTGKHGKTQVVRRGQEFRLLPGRRKSITLRADDLLP